MRNRAEVSARLYSNRMCSLSRNKKQNKNKSHSCSGKSQEIVILLTISNGTNVTEWSSIRSEINHTTGVITKSDDRAAGIRFVYHEYEYNTKSYYQLITKITISEIRIAKL